MIGIIGGTGPQGRGLAYRLARAGVDVLIGSRDPERGIAAAEEVALLAGGGATMQGAGKAELPARADMLLVTVPYEGLEATLGPLADEVGDMVVMSAVNKLSFAGGPQALPVEAGSSAEEVTRLLPAARVTTAFNNVSATHLRNTEHVFDEDVLVCGDDDEAVKRTVELASQVEGLRGVACGPLRLAFTIEAMTAVVISVNATHGVTAGLRITGL